MSLVSIQDLSLLDHDVVGNRLLIRRAIKNSKGNFYDISIGIDGANFNKATPPTLDPRIQILVHGCLNALQQQLEAQSKKVEKLDQLGFIIQKPAPDKPYESHALVAEVGQSVLDMIKKCPSLDYSSLKALHFSDTTKMDWRPEDADKCKWVGTKISSVHSGLAQLCDDFKDFSLGSYPSAITTSSRRSEAVSTGAGLTTPPKDVVTPVVPKKKTDGLPSSPPPPPIRLSAPLTLVTPPPKPLSDKKRLLEDEYKKWQYWQRPWFSVGRREPLMQVWDRISLRQFLGEDEITDVSDKAFVKNAVIKESKAIKNLFARWSKLAPAYYRDDHTQQTSDEASCSEAQKPKLYQDYLFKPIKDYWRDA